MNRDLLQLFGAAIIGLMPWIIGFVGNRHGAVMGKSIRLPCTLARLFGSKNSKVSGGVFIIQLWGIFCLLITLVLNMLSVDFATKSSVLLILFLGGGFLSIIAAKVYAKVTKY